MLWDSDGDGMDDATEALDYLTSPTNDDVFAFADVAERVGTDTVARAGEWAADGTALCAAGLRGWLEYDFTISTSDVYRVDVEGSDCSSWQVFRSFELVLKIDEQQIARCVLETETNAHGHAGAFTPWLTEGAHTVRVEWDNASYASLLRVESIRLQQLSGLDTDGDGRKDWVERRLARLSGVDTAVWTSVTSPGVLEGNDPWPVLSFANDTNALCHGANGRWYWNAPLAETGAAAQILSFQNGGLIQTALTTWAATDLLATNAPLAIRLDDTLKLAAYPPGATAGTEQISIGGITNYVTTAPNHVCHTFSATGTFTVTGTYLPPGEGALAGVCTVAVFAATLDPDPAVWVGTKRAWVCTNLPDVALVEAGSDLSITESGSGGGSRVFDLETSVPGDHGIVARIGSGGPILTSVTARAFRLAMEGETYVSLEGVCRSGEALFATPVVMSPVPDDVRLEGRIIMGDILFEDGTTERTWTSTNFDETGVCTFRFIRAASSRSSFCNILDVYQGTNLIGRHTRP